MELTLDQLKKILPTNKNPQDWLPVLAKVLPKYEINSVNRVAAFVSQCSHESGGFNALQENLNYRADVLTRLWPTRFPADVAAAYVAKPNKQEAIANRAYCDRMGNGNEASGDGWKYRGRGLIQLTGKSNYQAFANSIGVTVEKASEYLATLEGAAESAAWFWKKNNLNELADKGDTLAITKRINGGTNGLDDRVKKYNEALNILNS
jgi:putative chitinase